MQIVAALLGIITWLGRLGPWLLGVLTAFFSMLGVRDRVARILGIVTKMLIVVVVASVVPLPGWLTDLPTKLASLPESFWWFADLIELRFGVYVICGAYLFRWGWRLFTKD